MNPLDVDRISEGFLAGENELSENEVRDLVSELVTLLRMQRDLTERMKLEAILHAGEARVHKSTVQEIYQLVSGFTGEKGTWHGARPVRDFLASQRDRLDRLRTALLGPAVHALTRARRNTYEIKRLLRKEIDRAYPEATHGTR